MKLNLGGSGSESLEPAVKGLKSTESLPRVGESASKVACLYSDSHDQFLTNYKGLWGSQFHATLTFS